MAQGEIAPMDLGRCVQAPSTCPHSLVALPQAISTHYASSHCQYIDVEGTSQDIVLKEVQDLAKKRLGSDATVSLDVSVSRYSGEWQSLCIALPCQMVWQIKGVCVKGEKANL